VVGKLLGHKQARTTEIYAHLAADPLKAVANDTASVIADLIGVARPAEMAGKPVLQAAE